MGHPQPAASPPALVIFDCDGVLVDSEPISNRVLAELLTRCGLPTTTEQALAIYKGLIMRDVVARAEAQLGRALPADFVGRFETERADEFRRRLHSVPGAGAAVRAVRDAGVPVCVATQGKPEKTELTLGLTGLRKLFAPDAVFTSYGVARGKPFPDLFLHAAEAMGAPAAATAVVEDTPIGVAAGVAAGMRVLGYAADADPEALRAAGAEPFDDLGELPALLGLAA